MTVRIEGLVVRLGGFELSIDELIVERGEYLVVLGPSGVGKTVFLHTIAGIIKPLRGRIVIDGVDVTHEPPERRGVALIPQNYALFPHMSVYDNIAYGLKARGLKEKQVRERVLEVARMLEIEGLLRKKPNQLSGGEQQRVALARALVIGPRLLLLDEPLASLDPRLRAKARRFLKELHEELGFTAIHVTHSIVEAVYLGHRIAYMERGAVRLVAKPHEFLESGYAKPYLEEVQPLLDALSLEKTGRR